MSTYWHVACRTCDEIHPFNDANHQDVFMSRVAKLAPLLATLGPLDGDVELTTQYGRIDVWWFARHKGHDIVARNEYGAYCGDCNELFKCGGCGTRRHCQMPVGHDGAHGLRAPAQDNP